MAFNSTTENIFVSLPVPIQKYAHIAVDNKLASIYGMPNSHEEDSTMPGMRFPNVPTEHQEVITDIDNWDPKVLDVPDNTTDKVAWIFQKAAVGAARKLVAIANGDHNYDHRERGATTALKVEVDVCKYILEAVHQGVAAEQPWSTWARDLVKGTVTLEPSGAELMEGHN